VGEETSMRALRARIVAGQLHRRVGEGYLSWSNLATAP
jgi:hypothetical protein